MPDCEALTLNRREITDAEEASLLAGAGLLYGLCGVIVGPYDDDVFLVRRDCEFDGPMDAEMLAAGAFVIFIED